MQFFDAKVDKELIQEWTGISRQLGSSSQKNHSGTDGACVRRPWLVVFRRRLVTDKSEAPSKR